MDCCRHEGPAKGDAKFDIVINLTPAKALSFKIPQSVLLRANRVIE